ncbi:Flavanone 3-dioxygenase [Bertholletia excelsa]
MAGMNALVESGCLPAVSPEYAARSAYHDVVLTEGKTIPIVDFSLLTCGKPDERSKVIQDLRHACREWGFFMVVNHSMPRKLMEEMLMACQSYFNLPEEDKEEYKGKKLFDPIRSGTSFNVSVDKPLFWREYLKLHVHPHFNAPISLLVSVFYPKKSSNSSSPIWEISEKYCREARLISNELLKGISLSLGLEESYISKTMEVENGSQLQILNLYPPCPRPELALGMPPHSDHGLLTLVIEDKPYGLQILHNNAWVPICPLPNSILVNTGDHMEIFTNGLYKSVLHRVVVKEGVSRLSVAVGHGPPLGKPVKPAPELVDPISFPSAFRGITYREYIELQQSHELNGKSCLDRIRV